MPKREKCPMCQGSGEVKIAGRTRTCESCGGKKYTIRTGKRQHCFQCDGSGKMGFFKKCPECQGKGYIFV